MDIKPCPFCGAPADLGEDVFDGSPAVACDNPACRLSRDDFCMPPEDWNQRGIEDELLNCLKGLVRYADSVRYTAGMGKNQAGRLELAKWVIGKAEGKL